MSAVVRVTRSALGGYVARLEQDTAGNTYTAAVSPVSGFGATPYEAIGMLVMSSYWGPGAPEVSQRPIAGAPSLTGITLKFNEET